MMTGITPITTPDRPSKMASVCQQSSEGTDLLAASWSIQRYAMKKQPAETAAINMPIKMVESVSPNRLWKSGAAQGKTVILTVLWKSRISHQKPVVNGELSRK